MDGDEHQEDAPTTDEAPAPAMPNYLLEPNAVLLDDCRWRHGQVTKIFTCCQVSPSCLLSASLCVVT